MSILLPYRPRPGKEVLTGRLRVRRSPLTRDLAHAVNYGDIPVGVDYADLDVVVRDLVTGANWSANEPHANADVDIINTRWGRASRVSNQAFNIASISIPSADEAPAGDNSWWFYLIPQSGSQGSVEWFATSGTTQGLAIDASTNVVEGVFGSTARIDSGSVSVVNGVPVQILYVITGSGGDDYKLYIDGVDVSSNVSTGFGNPGGLSMLNGLDGQGYRAVDILAAADWARALTPEEAETLARDPNALWEPTPSRIFLPPAAGGVVVERTVTDGIQFEDPDQKTQEALQRVDLLTQSLDARERAAYLLEQLLISDSAAEQRVKARALADNLLVLGQDRREAAHLFLDRLLARDDVFRDEAHQVLDLLLLRDSVTAERGKAVTLLDSILLRDSDYRDRGHVALDNLFLFDTVDAEIAGQVVVNRSVTDFLFLLDAESEDRQVVRTALLRDLLFVVDSVEAAVGSVVNRSVTDLLLFDEDRTSIRELFAADSALMQSLSMLDRDLVLPVETLLIGTNYNRVLETILSDRLQMSDLIVMVREIAVSQGLELSDTELAQVTTAVVEAITFVRLRAVDLLGVRLGHSTIESRIDDL